LLLTALSGNWIAASPYNYFPRPIIFQAIFWNA